MIDISDYYIKFHGMGLIIALAAGIILLVLRPYWAFLFATFVVLAFSINTLAFTRDADLGAFFNLYDACFLISLMAYVMDRERQVLLPSPAVVMLAVLVMGLLVSCFKFGLNYFTLRAFRIAITLPLQFFLTAGMVSDEDRLKSLLKVLFISVLAAELQHLFLVGRASEVVESVSFLRTNDFGLAGSEVWLLTGPFLVGSVIPHPWLQMAAGIIFLMANFSHQTRSIAIGFMGGLLVYYGWFIKGPHAFRWQRFKLFLPAFMIGVVLLAIVGLSGVTQSYADRLFNTFEKKDATKAGLKTRELDYKIEFHDWLHGNLIFGEGLWYFQKYGAGKQPTGVAWGHLGYISYLSQLGIIGFIVYGFWFPLTVLKKARKLIASADISPAVLYLGLMTGACFIIQPLIYTMSGSFLARTFLPGILGGAVWAVSAFPKEQMAGDADTSG